MAASVAKMSLLAVLGGLCLAAPARAGGCAGRECYRYAVMPPVYETVQRTVLVQPPRTVYRTIPPVYDTISEEVVVSPGSRVWQESRGPAGERIGCWVTTPPRTAIRQRTVLVRPAETVPETLAPDYALVGHRVLVAPARGGWVPVGGPAVGSIPDVLGITGASSADLGVALGFSRGSIYDGY